MAKYHILYNPLAGNGACTEKVRELSSILSGDELEYCDMTKISDYGEFFASIPAEDRVLVAGGDGTLNRFVNDTLGLEYGRDIYYFAAGSGNDFLHDLELSEKENIKYMKEKNYELWKDLYERVYGEELKYGD